MILNRLSFITKHYWQAIPSHFPHVRLGAYIVMPNHLHGVIHIIKNLQQINVGVGHVQPLRPVECLEWQNKTRHHRFQHIIPASIGSMVRGFKFAVTRWAQQNGYHSSIWQKNYWEHVIRSNNDLFKFYEYIRNNPANWGRDRNNPQNQRSVLGFDYS